MIINHNIAAINTSRSLNSASNAQSKSMEKLSSGLRINRAGDDAAGLAISEKMRGQIRGLDQASRNAQDGISLIQTAEGALSETHDILQRMRELAVQAGNGTNADSDSKEIQKEINQLTTEINRISNTTEFNTKKLLNGGKDDVSVTATTQGTAGKAATAAVYTLAGSDISFADTEDMTIGGKKYTADGTDNGIDGLVKKINADGTNAYSAAKEADGSITLTAKTSGAHTVSTGDFKKGADEFDVTEVTKGADAVTAEAGVYEFKLDVADLKDGQKLTIGSNSYTFMADGSGDFKNLNELATAVGTGTGVTAAAANGKITLTQETGKESAALPRVSVSAVGQTGNGFNSTLQIGANKNQTMQLDVKDMGAEALGLVTSTITKGLEVTNGTNNETTGSALNVLDQAGAANAIEVINNAIETVSGERSKLGAFQNRLEHTINNLGTSSENLTAAESRIRDVDMASEMVEQTKNSILSQAAQAMLAQANQQPQAVLQLLR